MLLLSVFASGAFAEPTPAVAPAESSAVKWPATTEALEARLPGDALGASKPIVDWGAD